MEDTLAKEFRLLRETLERIEKSKTLDKFFENTEEISVFDFPGEINFPDICDGFKKVKESCALDMASRLVQAEKELRIIIIYRIELAPLMFLFPIKTLNIPVARAVISIIFSKFMLPYFSSNIGPINSIYKKLFFR